MSVANLSWKRWLLAGLLIVIGIDEVLFVRGIRIRRFRVPSYSHRVASSSYRVPSSSHRVPSSSSVRHYAPPDTRVRVSYNNHRPWRLSGSWQDYGKSGHIYGYVYYTGSNRYNMDRYREPTTCRNEYDNLMENGTNYKWFICPRMGDPDNYDVCCGVEDRQQCCENYIASTPESRGLSVVAGISMGVGLPLAIVSLIGICAFLNVIWQQRKRKARSQERSLSRAQPAVEMTQLAIPSLNGPNRIAGQNSRPQISRHQPVCAPQSAGYQNGRALSAYQPSRPAGNHFSPSMPEQRPPQLRMNYKRVIKTKQSHLKDNSVETDRPKNRETSYADERF